MSNLHIGWVLSLLSAIITIAAATGKTWNADHHRPTVEGWILIVAALLLMLFSGVSAWKSELDAKNEEDALQGELSSVKTQLVTMGAENEKSTKELRAFQQKDDRNVAAVCRSEALSTHKSVSVALQHTIDQSTGMEKDLASLLENVHTDTVAQVNAAEASLASQLAQTATADSVNAVNKRIDALQADHQSLQVVMQKVQTINDTALRLANCPSVASPVNTVATGLPSSATAPAVTPAGH
jgi:hypothetical protein